MTSGKLPVDPAPVTDDVRKAAEQGHAYAQERLGCLQEPGHGMPKDLAAPPKPMMTEYPLVIGGRSMLAQVFSGAVQGVDAYLVEVEVDLAMVGLPDIAVNEASDTAARSQTAYHGA